MRQQLPFSGTLAAILVAWLQFATPVCPLSAPWLSSYESLLGGFRSFMRRNPPQVDFKDVKEDIKKLLLDSQPFWPADYGNYGPLTIRMAWHCSGTYRSWDGRGGCDGGNLRFDPVRDWPDNTNLDKTVKLLWPIKEKYGAGLSWGDLFVLTGTTAIESMGGPVLGFCGGRIDDLDGTPSLHLGPTPEQERIAPCGTQGNCSAPLAQDTMGLIYVNPEGPFGQPDPTGSATQIRSVFGRMGWNDREIVAIIGGGHAFGKAHGACPSGAGPSPSEQPSDPYPGTCGSGPMKGKGPNAFTSGLEGPWTTQPTTWDNEYFRSLLQYDWEPYVGPGGKHQWRPKRFPEDDETGPLPAIMMFTTDIALIRDEKFLAWVKLYAKNITELEVDFSHGWYKMVTRDMGPVERCLGPFVPPAQPFQRPLPPPLTPLPNFTAVANDIRAALTTPSAALDSDVAPGGDGARRQPYYGALFADLAFRCAATFRATDYQGGCNGARIRFPPARDWAANVGLDKVLKVLEPVKAKYDTLSHADLIVLAGTVAVEDAGGMEIAFCGGRSDAEEQEEGFADKEDDLAPRVYAKGPEVGVKDSIAVMGMTLAEGVALAARPRSPLRQRLLGYSGSWAPEASGPSNQYFKVLLNQEWEASISPGGQPEYRAVAKAKREAKAEGKCEGEGECEGNSAGDAVACMTPEDLAIRWDNEMLAVAQSFAEDDALFRDTFAKAWLKLMNADRFKGPSGNVCSDSDSGPEVASASK